MRKKTELSAQVIAPNKLKDKQMQNQKPDKRAFVRLEVTTQEKNAWVIAAKPQKLAEWIADTLNRESGNTGNK